MPVRRLTEERIQYCLLLLDFAARAEEEDQTIPGLDEALTASARALECETYGKPGL
jgi:hypothetical protein